MKSGDAKLPKRPSRSAKNLAADPDDFHLHAGDDDFEVHAPRGPRRFIEKDPLWRRVLMRPSTYLSPIIVGGAVSAFLINALMLQNGTRSAMTLGWPFNAISKSSIERLNTPKDAMPVPMPPKRTDAGDANAAQTKSAAVDAADPYAALLKETANMQNTGDPALQRAQRVLNRLGYGPIPVDGTLSQQTRAALQRFGRDRGLTPGPQTETAILKQLGHSGDTTQD
jgi:hypothetical protein